MQNYVSNGLRVLGRSAVIGTVALVMVMPAAGQEPKPKMGVYQQGSDTCKYNGKTIVCIDNKDANNSLPDVNYLVTASRNGSLIEFLIDIPAVDGHNDSGHYEVAPNSEAAAIKAKGRIPIHELSPVTKNMQKVHDEIKSRVMREEYFVK